MINSVKAKIVRDSGQQLLRQSLQLWVVAAVIELGVCRYRPSLLNFNMKAANIYRSARKLLYSL